MRTIALALAFTTFAGTALAREDQWREGDPPPPGFHYEARPRTGAIIAGSVVFGVPYVFSAIAASAGVAGTTPDLALLYIPVAGPILTLALASPSEPNHCCGSGITAAVAYLGLGVDAVLQVTGAILLIYGLASKKHTLVPDSAALRIAPMVSPRIAGVSVGVDF
jgi:hypothetical protein